MSKSHRTFSIAWTNVDEVIWALARPQLMHDCDDKRLPSRSVLRVLCAGIFAKCPDGARAIAAASVRAPGGRLRKEAFVAALLTTNSSRSSSVVPEDVPTLRVRLCDLFPPNGDERPCRGVRNTAVSVKGAELDEPPRSGVALEAWASQVFFDQLRRTAPDEELCSQRPWKPRPRPRGQTCESCGCWLECEDTAGECWSQRSFGKGKSAMCWADSLRNPAGWHYFDFSAKPQLPLRQRGARRTWASTPSTGAMSRTVS